jgi:transposase
MVEYKCQWHGRGVIVVDRWFPSSKVCSACGALGGGLPLDVRQWTCRCGAVHDRDVVGDAGTLPGDREIPRRSRRGDVNV